MIYEYIMMVTSVVADGLGPNGNVEATLIVVQPEHSTSLRVTLPFPKADRIAVLDRFVVRVERVSE